MFWLTLWVWTLTQIAAQDAGGFLLPGMNLSNTVYYELTVSMGLKSPDCYQRPVMLINGQFPGPTMRAPARGRLVVKVTNSLFYEGLTLHWHGLHCKGTPQYDGVAYGTQMPLLPGQSFTYNIDLTSNPPGTYWYHAHYQLQSQSVLGALIIDDREDSGAANSTTIIENPNLFPYPYHEELTLILSDWFHQSDEEQLLGLLGSPFKWIGDPQTLLINGKGRFDCSLAQNGACDVTQCEYENLYVQQNKTYRLRLIGATSLTYLSFAIAGHNLTVVEIDGTIIEPFDTEHVEVNSGQRFSVLLHANKDPAIYRISTEVRWRKAGPTGIALLTYLESRQTPITNPALYSNISSLDTTDRIPQFIGPPLFGFPDGVPFFPPWNNGTPPSEVNWAVGKLRPIEPIRPPKATREVLVVGRQMAIPNLAMGGNFTTIKWTLNGVAFEHPLDAALLHTVAQGPSVMQAMLNPEHTAPLVIQLYKGDVIDIVLQNTVALNGICEQHPWHLHGHHFWDLGGGPGNYSDLTQRDLSRLLNYRNPLRRDSTTLFPYTSSFSQQNPPGVSGSPCGFRVLRFRADNPGVWNFHCHIPAHMHIGMQMFFAERIDEIPALLDMDSPLFRLESRPESATEHSALIYPAWSIFALFIALLNLN